ncbi:putative heme A:farnesyltransferase [Cavenderia fasciculata]|uniref:Protoheme IX farnesyltransferase, mitochondrial n=1 Tax=Cavenderia fasciculata TaxID=261658 RepID=F4QBP1_CACFS|nr:putative heme A:farnesyltransferase [Cavenderia fasciculata]EGG14629.1 putative heme A:farnesyltransferase [Cavenderia fasciculata]|eukprot:XP_004351137.1 putative heme A:farnesyltransferase [Cavenderia fasciculata]
MVLQATQKSTAATGTIEEIKRYHDCSRLILSFSLTRAVLSCFEITWEGRQIQIKKQRNVITNSYGSTRLKELAPGAWDRISERLKNDPMTLLPINLYAAILDIKDPLTVIKEFEPDKEDVGIMVNSVIGVIPLAGPILQGFFSLFWKRASPSDNISKEELQKELEKLRKEMLKAVDGKIQASEVKQWNQMCQSFLSGLAKSCSTLTIHINALKHQFHRMQGADEQVQEAVRIDLELIRDKALTLHEFCSQEEYLEHTIPYYIAALNIYIVAMTIMDSFWYQIGISPIFVSGQTTTELVNAVPSFRERMHNNIIPALKNIAKGIKKAGANPPIGLDLSSLPSVLKNDKYWYPIPLIDNPKIYPAANPTFNLEDGHELQEGIVSIRGGGTIPDKSGAYIVRIGGANFISGGSNGPTRPQVLKPEPITGCRGKIPGTVGAVLHIKLASERKVQLRMAVEIVDKQFLSVHFLAGTNVVDDIPNYIKKISAEDQNLPIDDPLSLVKHKWIANDSTKSKTGLVWSPIYENTKNFAIVARPSPIIEFSVYDYILLYRSINLITQSSLKLLIIQSNAIHMSRFSGALLTKSSTRSILSTISNGYKADIKNGRSSISFSSTIQSSLTPKNQISSDSQQQQQLLYSNNNVFNKSTTITTESSKFLYQNNNSKLFMNQDTSFLRNNRFSTSNNTTNTTTTVQQQQEEPISTNNTTNTTNTTSSNELKPKKKSPFAFMRQGYFNLVKFPISIYVTFTTVAGYVMTAPIVDPMTLGLVSLGTFLASASASAYNQEMEVSFDAKMPRTKSRPLVTGEIKRDTGFLLACGASVLGCFILVPVNPVCGALAMSNILLYILYTQMKRTTPWNTWVGAFVGAIPPLIGTVAGAGGFEPIGALLATVLYIWQIPHFLALAEKLKSQYAMAGYKMLPVTHPHLNYPVSFWHAIAGVVAPFAFQYFCNLNMTTTTVAFFSLSSALLAVEAVLENKYKQQTLDALAKDYHMNIIMLIQKMMKRKRNKNKRN